MQIVEFPKREEFDAKAVLTKALEEEFGDVIVIGWQKETGALYMGHSSGSLPEVAFLLDLAKKLILEEVM